MHPLQETEQQQDRPYIVRRPPRNGLKVQHVIGTELYVGQVEQTRSTGRSIGGMFREVESTGKMVAGVLRVRLQGLSGHGQKRDHGELVKTTPVEVKKFIRRVRAEELALLAEHDQRIDEIEQQLKAARAARAETAAEAWVRAHVVTVKELDAIAAASAAAKSRGGAWDDPETRKQIAKAHAEIRAAFGSRA